ncbi:MAG: hypothetical protein WC261_13460 [Synergistaceae bacterium]|jgi:hypothetical protein
MTQRQIARVTGAYVALIGNYLESDLDHDLDLDPSLRLKDQIRSDLDHDEEDVETRFRTLAAKYGIDLEDVELSTIERNMFWFVQNLDTVRYPAAYIRKMVRDCGVRRRVGFQPPASSTCSTDRTQQRKAEDSEEKETTEIYGYPVEELDKMAPYLDYSTYSAISAVLPASSRILFRSFEDVRSSRAKTRVFLAEGKKRGVL